MALDEARIWSCSGNGRVYYSTVSNPDWQCVSTNITCVATGYCGVVCATDDKDVLHIRTGVSDINPLGQSWVSLLCECKHVCVGSTKLLRITSDNQMYAANLPNVIDKNIYLTWYVVNLQDNLSDSNLISVDVYDNLYIADRSGDVYKYIEDHLAIEQSFWKLIVTAPKIPQGLLSRLRSFASLGMLSGENDGNVDACGFYVSEKYLWLTRRNSREVYQMEYDSSEEPVSSWSRFRLTYTWTITCICGCQDSTIWATTSEGKLVTITCNGKKVLVKECLTPSLSTEDHSSFRWAGASVGFIRQFPLSRRSSVHMPSSANASIVPSPISASVNNVVTSPVSTSVNASIMPLPVDPSISRVPPSSLSLYPSLPVEGEERIELTSNGSFRQTRECCDDGSCGYCSGQELYAGNSILSPVQLSLQKKGHLVSGATGLSGSAGLSAGAKRKHDFTSNGEVIINERVILKAKRRKIRSQLPKQKILQGVKFSLSQKLITMDNNIMKYDPDSLQVAEILTHSNNKLFSFELEEGLLSGNQETTVGVQCMDDMEFNNVENMEIGESQEICLPPPLPSANVSKHSTENLSAPVQSHDDAMESVTQYSVLERSYASQEVSMPVPLPVVRPSQPESLSENLSTPVQSSSCNESMESIHLAGLPEHPVSIYRQHLQPTMNQQQPPPAPPPPPIAASPPRIRPPLQVTCYSEQVVYPVEESATENMSVEPLPTHRHITHNVTASSDDSTSDDSTSE